MDDRLKRINRAISDSQLSYRELSELTKISKSALQRYVTGETEKIPIDVIERIARATGVSAAHIMGWEKSSDFKQGIQDALLIKKYNQLTEANKSAVLNLIDNLLKG